MSRKNLIIVLSAVLLALGASGQQKRLDGSSIRLQRPLSLEKPPVAVQEMKMRALGEKISSRSRSEVKLKPFYRRPAGAFYCTMLAENGVGGYSFGQEFAFFKPYSGYTYCGKVEGADENTHYGWDVFHADSEIEYIDDELEVNVTYGMSIQPVPIFYAVDGNLDDLNAAWYSYQMPYFNNSAQDGPLISPHNPANAMAIPSSRLLSDDEDLDFLLSSRTNFSSVFDDVMYPFVTYSGAEPYGDNPQGWWFGKNGGRQNGLPCSPRLFSWHFRAEPFWKGAFW